MDSFGTEKPSFFNFSFNFREFKVSSGKIEQIILLEGLLAHRCSFERLQKALQPLSDVARVLFDPTPRNPLELQKKE
jgi:hypothetical protein